MVRMIKLPAAVPALSLTLIERPSVLAVVVARLMVPGPLRVIGAPRVILLPVIQTVLVEPAMAPVPVLTEPSILSVRLFGPRVIVGLDTVV